MPNPRAIEPPSGPSTLAEDTVDIWSAWLDVSAEVQRFLHPLLTTPEQERSEKYRFEQHRNRYIVGRAFLRRILGSYLQIDPAEVRFDYTPEGKPGLSAEHGDCSLQFNLAHSEDLAVLAVTRIGPVGVDVERIRPFVDATDIVGRFFSPKEIARYIQLGLQEQVSAFFDLWTRKEAMLKATGKGIAGALDRVEVTFGDGEEARVLALPCDCEDPGEWKLRAFSPAPGFAGAVAFRAWSACFAFRTWEI